jgi:hypothetical protein
MRARQTKSQDPIIHFFADESWIEIETKNHLVVGAIGVSDPGAIAIEVVGLKKDFGLPPLEEIKWNSGKTLSEAQRHGISQGMLSIIRKCRGFITIIEGNDKQKSTELLFHQIFEYCARHTVAGYTFSIDQDMVKDARGFKRWLQDFGDPRLIGIQMLDSATDQLIQCADFFVGAYRTAMRQILGDAPTKIIKLPLRDEEFENWSLPDYVVLGTRGMLWSDAKSPDYDIPPTLYSSGKGFRVHSSISKEALSLLEKHVATVNMECLH